KYTHYFCWTGWYNWLCHFSNISTILSRNFKQSFLYSNLKYSPLKKLVRLCLFVKKFRLYPSSFDNSVNASEMVNTHISISLSVTPLSSFKYSTLLSMTCIVMTSDRKRFCRSFLKINPITKAEKERINTESSSL